MPSGKEISFELSKKVQQLFPAGHPLEPQQILQSFANEHSFVKLREDLLGSSFLYTPFLNKQKKTP
jgi:hypothetical protein